MKRLQLGDTIFRQPDMLVGVFQATFMLIGAFFYIVASLKQNKTFHPPDAGCSASQTEKDQGLKRRKTVLRTRWTEDQCGKKDQENSVTAI